MTAARSGEPRSCTECDRPHLMRGLCRAHYLEARSRRDFVPQPGRGRRLGTSTLSPALQECIAHELLAGTTLSAIARDLGVSRDQVRTVRGYLERLNA